MTIASDPVDEKTQAVNEKAVAGSETDTTSAASPIVGAERDDDVDDAFKYLHDHAVADGESTSINLAALRRKIDWRIVPIMFACYVLQFIDKVVINVRLKLPSPLCHDYNNVPFIVCGCHGNQQGPSPDQEQFHQRRIRLLHRLPYRRGPHR